MVQIQLDPAIIVSVDYESPSLPPLFQQFRPAVFRDGDRFCCILGPDKARGIYGCADSADQVIKDWEMRARERVSRADELDEVAAYMRDHLSTFAKDVW